jgi:hypothetical protein
MLDICHNYNMPDSLVPIDFDQMVRHRAPTGRLI